MYQQQKEVDSATKVLNNYFDKIYVISLKESHDRHDFISKSLEGLSFEFFFGQDKKELTSEKITNIYDDKRAKQNKRQPISFRKSEIAISLSHRMVYEKMVKEDISNALIFEDDAFFIDQNKRFIPNILKEIPENWDLIYFGYFANEQKTRFDNIKQKFYLLLRTFALHKKTKNQIRNRFPKNYSNHLSIAGRHDCIHAYALTKKAAKIFIEFQNPIQYLADHLIAKVCGEKLINAFITKPKIFDQGSFGENVFMKTLNRDNKI